MSMQNLKMGDAFQFVPNGPVYVRCRGGFRLGTGGPLYGTDKRLTVILYKP